MKIDTTYFLSLVAKHKEYLTLDKMASLFAVQNGDCTNVQDCLLMYLLILEHKPQHVVEFSPMLGYSTRYLASALKILNKPDSMITVEINQNYFIKTGERLDKAGLLHICHVLSGDAISVVKKEITTRNRQVDFVFIDSDHSRVFAEKYIKEIFPLLSDNCIIVVHDICGVNAGTGPHSLNFKSSLTSNSDKFAEYKPIKKYLEDNKKDFTLTHPLFGGWWKECAWRKILPNEASPKLPQNKAIYEGFKTIMKYDLRNYLNFQHPNALVFKK